MRSVLVVDDDPFIRRLIVTTLEDVAGFELVEAEDGQEALAVAARERPAIVFLDIDMPKLNGIDACRALRDGEEDDSTVIVMLTAGAEHEQAARDAGADLFLTKPFSPLDLLRLVDELGRSRLARRPLRQRRAGLDHRGRSGCCSVGGAGSAGAGGLWRWC